MTIIIFKNAGTFICAFIILSLFNAAMVFAYKTSFAVVSVIAFKRADVVAAHFTRRAVIIGGAISRLRRAGALFASFAVGAVGIGGAAIKNLFAVASGGTLDASASAVGVVGALGAAASGAKFALFGALRVIFAEWVCGAACGEEGEKGEEEEAK